MNLNVMIALCSLWHSEVQSLCCLCWLRVQREQGWCCTQWPWFSSQCLAIPNLSVSTCISSKTICCLCLVRKVCSDAWPMQARMVATVQCVKEIFQISAWKMSMWSDQGWHAGFCSFLLPFYNSVFWLFKIWSAMCANSQGIEWASCQQHVGM